MKKLFLFIFILTISFPFLANAREGLVPCGPGTADPVCKFCHIFVLFENIVNFFLFEIVPPLAVLMIVIGGIYFFTSAGDPNKVNKGKGILTTVITGLVIIYCAWIFINFFFVFIGLSDFGLSLTGPNKWFQIQCQ